MPAAAAAATSSSSLRENTTEQLEAGEGERESQVTSPSSGAVSTDEAPADPNATYAAVCTHTHARTLYYTCIS